MAVFAQNLGGFADLNHLSIAQSNTASCPTGHTMSRLEVTGHMVPDYGPWASALTGVAVAAKEELGWEVGGMDTLLGRCSLSVEGA